MRTLFTIAALGAALSIPSRAAAEWVQDGEAKVWIADVRGAAEVTAPIMPHAVVIPRGFHAHDVIGADGKVTKLVHHDSNFGKAAPHAGVIGNDVTKWPKTGYAGDTVMVGGDVFATAADTCPGGKCPVGAGPRSSVASVTTRSVQTSRASVGRSGPLRRIFGAVFRGRR